MCGRMYAAAATSWRGMSSVMKAGGGPKWQTQQLREEGKNRTQQAVSPISNYGCIKLHASSGSMPMVFRTNLSPKVRLERGILLINWSWNLTWRLKQLCLKSVCVLPSNFLGFSKDSPQPLPPGPSEGSKVVT